MLPVHSKATTLSITEKRQSVLLENEPDDFFMPPPSNAAAVSEASRSSRLSEKGTTKPRAVSGDGVVAREATLSENKNIDSPPDLRETKTTPINRNRPGSFVFDQNDESRIKFDLNPGLDSLQNDDTSKKTEVTPGKEDSESSSLAERTTVSATDQIVRKFRQKFIILHYSPFKAVWDWIILLLVVYTAVFTPFTVAFLLNEDEKRAILNQHASTRLFKKQQSGADPFVIIDLIVDLMFLLDIFISFRTTYVSKEGEAIYDPMTIAKNYLKGWFIIDAFSAMPYDLLLFGSGNIDTIKITGLLKTFRLIRLIRIFPKLQKFSEYGLAMLLLLLAVFALVGHWLACVFYAIAYIERPTLPDPKYSWLDHLAEKYNMPFLENNSDSGPDLKSKYITALFFTLTSLTSVGFGNVSPNTNYEKIFSICSMMLGSLISAAIFGNVTTIMMKMYQGTEELKEMQESVKDFIKFHSIPKQLEKRMQESFEHTWSYTNGIDMNMVLKSFPESLQADICLHLNRQLLNTCTAFLDASDGCLRMLALKFNSTHVPPGDTLIHKGDNLTAIYFIARGTLEISRDDEVLAILDKNDIFGENIGKYQERDIMGRSSCDVRALSYCDLHKIERADLLDVMETYPDFADSFEEKFQVTFDLRECELSEQKPTKKKLSKASKGSAAVKRSSKTSSKSGPLIPASVTPPGAQPPPPSTNIDKPIFQIENVDHDDATEQNYLQSSLSSVKRLDSMTGDVSLNNSGLSRSIQKQRSVNSYSSAASSNVMSVNPTRRVSGILRKKSRMIRNMARMLPNTSAAANVDPNAPVVAASTSTLASPTNQTLDPNKRQLTTVGEFEAEIESLVMKLDRIEDTLNTQMTELTDFILNVVVNNEPKNTAVNDDRI